MKALTSVAIAMLFAAGCGEKSSQPTQSTNSASSGSPLTAPVDYLGAVAKAQQSAVKTVDTTSIKKAIDLFAADNGRYPKDLNELVAQKYMPQIPTPPVGTKFSYDPQTGEVKVVSQ
jgi:hypothetical protein